MLSSPPGVASAYISPIEDRFSGTFFFFKEWDLVTGGKRRVEEATLSVSHGEYQLPQIDISISSTEIFFGSKMPTNYVSSSQGPRAFLAGI